MNKMKWKLEFYDRFARQEAELERLYRELYHNDMAAFDRFTDMLYDAYLARPESLKLMDRAREAHPDWYKGHDLRLRRDAAGRPGEARLHRGLRRQLPAPDAPLREP